MLADASFRRSAVRAGFVKAAVAVLLALAGGLIALLAGPVAGGKHADGGKRLADGVTLHRVKQGDTTFRAVCIDLSRPGVKLDVVADDIAFREGRVTGRARSVAEWVARRNAIAGVNGGFFGETVQRDFKEIVGLLKVAGKVRSAGPTFRSRQGVRYVHSAFGLTEAAAPRIDWVASVKGSPQQLRQFGSAEVSGRGESWSVFQAVGCGPRLVKGGQVSVATRAERLASPGELPRTLVGYGGAGKSRRVVLAIADGAEFQTCATFLTDFFSSRCRIPCEGGMALDGGSSTSLAWREGRNLEASPPLAATVPTAILVSAR